MKRRLIIIDGPPASGKTTLSYKFFNKLGGYVTRYRAFGPANIMTQYFKLNIIYYDNKIIKILRNDLFLTIPLEKWEKIKKLIFLLELIYKFFQQFIIITILLLKKVVILDEFMILRLANYINVVINNKFSYKIMKYLFIIDLKFAILLSKFSSMIYIYMEPNLTKMMANWQHRGHRLPYDIKFLAIVRYSAHHIYHILNKNNIELIYLTDDC